jgi:hypothetical protein
MTEKTTIKSALVMLVEAEDGTMTIIDANEKIHEVADAAELMTCAKSIVSGVDMPKVESAPTSGPSAEERSDQEKIERAFGTIGSRLREVAEAEYGAPLVDAASTVLSVASKKTSGILQKISRGRKSGSGRYSARKRRA